MITMSRVLPILFNTDMVQAILDGRKTVTRRIIKPQPEPDLKYKLGICVNGNILYVRETYAKHPKMEEYYYRADGECNGHSTEWGCPPGMKVTDNCELCAWLDGYIKWSPSIHMPKSAARIWLQVTDVRVERLQDMSRDDAIKEGIHFCECPDGYTWKAQADMNSCYITTMWAMKALWNSTIKKSDLDRYGWDANPWVWVIEFERCEKPEDRYV